jgi:hypothetical protein
MVERTACCNPNAVVHPHHGRVDHRAVTVWIDHSGLKKHAPKQSSRPNAIDQRRAEAAFEGVDFR